jgi:diacylglycerol kinase (ATP)
MLGKLLPSFLGSGEREPGNDLKREAWITMRPVTVAVLANPTAGRGKYAPVLPDVFARLGAEGHAVRLLPAGTREEALASAREAVAEGPTALVAVGGDGTVHLGLQAVAGTDVPFGIVPAGTGNDFAEQVGVPKDAMEAAAKVVAALQNGSTQKLDLAQCKGVGGEEIWFGAVLAAGFDAIVNERANHIRFPKGPQRYNVAIAIELARLTPRRYKMTLDGVPHEFDSVLVAVGNTSSYGGGYKIVPDADPADGLLDIVVGKPMGRLAFAKIRPKVYAGTHTASPLVETYRAKTIEIVSEGITAYADGERICPLPITITCVPEALTLLR